MLVIDESAAGHLDAQNAYFDGSLELLRELAVTSDLDAALPRLSAIVSKMLPHDALQMACFDQGGRPIVNASTADVPDMTPSHVDELIFDDLRSGVGKSSEDPHAMERLVGAGYRSVLRVSTCDPDRLVGVAFWSKRPLAFIARTCRSRDGSRTTSVSESAAASSARSPIISPTRVRSGSISASSEASTV